MTINKRRPAFSLVELIVATMISAFIGMSLVVIYSTANRHVFQTYRSNAVKAGLTLAMKSIRNAMGEATFIVKPAFVGSMTDELLVFSNLAPDPSNPNTKGCYPIAQGVPVSWQYFCYSGTNLLLYSGVIANPACTCPADPASACTNIAGLLPNFACGAAAPVGGTKLTLAQNIYTPTVPFARISNSAVQATIRVKWTPSGGLANTQREVDRTLSSVFLAGVKGN